LTSIPRQIGAKVEFSENGVPLTIWGEEATSYKVLPDGQRGRNARGITLTKRTTGASRAKGQADGGHEPSGRGSGPLKVRVA
jgi:hypothetical protein